MDPSPTIAIVGRPNVGKSTIFNRLIGKRYAIIAEEAGTTRDRISQKFDCNGFQTILVDTGGLEYGKKEDIEEDVQSQAKIAIEDADLAIFVVDCTQDLTPNDFAAAEILRKSKKEVILVANKCDNKSLESEAFNMYELGFGEPITISAIHKMGLEKLTHAIEKELKRLKFKKRRSTGKENENLSISILGKPNAGKSSLVNALLGHEKVIVSDIAGTTRDTTDTEIIFEGKHYNLIDTAGLRKRGKRERGIEKFSAMRCISAIERSEVVVLLIDGEQSLSSQDTHIAQYVLEAEKGLIIAVNKIDLLEKGEEERDKIINKLRRRMSFVPWAPVVFISAKNKKNTQQILRIAGEIEVERKKKIKTAELNSYMKKIIFKHLPASVKINKPKFSFTEQIDTNPPKFILFFKNAKNLHFSYPRYLENNIRAEYGFTGTPINLKFKEKAE